MERNHEKLGPASAVGGGRRGLEYPHLFRLLHWLLWPSSVILILTGLSQHAVSSPEWSLFKGHLPSFFWRGRVHLYHTWAAVVFSPAVLAVSWIYLRGRPRFRATQVVLLGGGAALVVSGVLLMTWPGPPAVYLTARWVHFVVGFGVLPIAFLWHAARGLTRHRRGLIPAFRPWDRPQWMHVVYFIPVVLVTTCLILNGLPFHCPWRDLVAKRIPPADPDTKHLQDLPWHIAGPLRIELTGGIGFDGGRTRVTLWALHDGNELFVKAQWQDPTEDRRYMPWTKTAGGWKHLVTDPDDESHYYEDKFSLIFPAQPDWRFERFGCAVYCHAGGGREAAVGKKYGYKGSDRIVDVWHWKSTRTDPCGQVDDKHWSEVDFREKDVGRHGDPKTGGDYKKNAGEVKTHPAFVPRDPGTLRHGIIPAQQAVEYDSPEAGELLPKIPEGAIVPGIVASAAAGDRGDVRCTSQHEDGQWTVYIRRKLDTGHRLKDGRPSDAVFTPGQPHPFGSAAFDHSSKRHAYGFPVYRLVLLRRSY